MTSYNKRNKGYTRIQTNNILDYTFLRLLNNKTAPYRDSRLRSISPPLSLPSLPTPQTYIPASPSLSPKILILCPSIISPSDPVPHKHSLPSYTLSSLSTLDPVPHKHFLPSYTLSSLSTLDPVPHKHSLPSYTLSSLSTLDPSSLQPLSSFQVPPPLPLNPQS